MASGAAQGCLCPCLTAACLDLPLENALGESSVKTLKMAGLLFLVIIVSAAFAFLGSARATSIRPEVLSVILGVGFLYVFYRAIQLQWPESYFGATDLSAYAIATSPIRYVAFRFAPFTLLVSLLR